MELIAAQQAVSDLWWATDAAYRFAANQWRLEQFGSVYWHEFEAATIGQAILTLTSPLIRAEGCWLPWNSEFALAMK